MYRITFDPTEYRGTQMHTFVAERLSDTGEWVKWDSGKGDIVFITEIVSSVLHDVQIVNEESE